MPADPTTPSEGERVGEQVQGRYRLVRFLGAGGMGEVYEAEHLQVGKRVAVKCMWPAFAHHPDIVERFVREARVASLVDSPHVVDVLDAGELADGTRFLVMELLRGVTLGAELAAVGAMPIERACRIIAQVALGVGAVHAAGITHRDLKPENVFLLQPGKNDHVKLLDFGVSKFARDDMNVALTRTGIAMGTPTYMSPEQSEGLRDVDGRTDIWSIGVILFRMLTGALPFAGESYARLLVSVLTTPAPLVRTLRPETSVALEAIVGRCLAKTPGDRFASTAEFLEALSDRSVLESPDESAPPSPQVTRTPNVAVSAPPPSDSETRLAPRRVLGSMRPPMAPGDDPARPNARPPAPIVDETVLAGPTTRFVPPPAKAAAPAMIGGSDNAMPFDEVILGGVGGKRLPARAFFELPLSGRIQHVIARTVVFLNRGVEVDRQEALAKMRERRAG